MTRLEELDAEADRLRAAGAPGSAFEALYKQGWRPPSYRESSGIEPCPSSCGVCYPVLSQRRKA